MSSYTISPKLKSNRVFILQKSELEKRWDPNTYHIERRSIIDALKKSGHQLQPLEFVSSFKKNLVKEIPENLPYLGLENIESNTGSYIATTEKESISSAIEFKKGQVLFPKLRPYLNKVYFAEFDGVCSTEFHVLDSKKVSNEYLANFLRTSLVVNQTKYLMSGNTLPRLQTEDIESLLIPILSKADEEKVNALMKKVFAQKQKNEAEAEKLLSSIDDYLLKELGITLPTPTENTLKNRMFVKSFKEISDSRIDPHFHQEKFKQLDVQLSKGKYPLTKLKKKSILITSGATPLSKGDSYTDDTSIGVPFVRSGEIKDITFEDCIYIKPEIHNTMLKSSQLKNGDLLIAIVGATIGEVGIYNHTREANINQAIALVRLSNELSPIFAKDFYKSSIGSFILDRAKRPVARANINLDEIGILPIPVPPLDKQKEIANYITDIRQQAQQLKDKTKELLKTASAEIEKILLT